MSLFHNYQLIEKVYEDSRSQINRAICPSDDSQILIKTIDSKIERSKAQEWLKQESSLINRLDAKSIIKLDKSKTQIDKLLFVLEDFPSQNLEQFLLEQSIAVPAFLAIAIQLAEALEAMHAQGIILRNLQPNCILINAQSLELKIIDFSRATNLTTNIIPQAQEIAELNIAYIAPEQTGRMNVPLDCRTDFYALGILFYRLITGQLPYNVADFSKLIHCHLAQKPLAPDRVDESIPAPISSIVMKLLAKNPADRYQSAAAISADLVNCQNQYVQGGAIEQFELGKLDLHSKFVVSPQLYGRSQARQEITESLAQLDLEAARMMLVTGTSGIGKTALVNEVVPTTMGKGYYITGKFDLLNSSTPYQAIIQALQELIQQLLTQTQAEQQLWQQKIQAAIANNGKVITNILPELELIIGSQPELTEVSAQESQNRFNTVFVKFLDVFVRAESPLILFLDDLQWADSASLNLIELVLNNLGDRHLLIIGAYRDDEIDPHHALSKTMARVAQTVPVEHLVLQPLGIAEINRLLTDSLHCQPQQSLSLAQLLFGRTSGNPFFVARLLQTFYREKLIVFDFKTSSWQWCIGRIRTTTITNYDVLELVCQNLSRLTPLCRQLLKLAACIGSRFDLEQLVDLWQEMVLHHADFTVRLDRQAIAPMLEDALKAGIIVFEHQTSKTSYQFLHHRIYQSIYLSLDSVELSQIHSIIGQFLFRQTNSTEIEPKIFEIVRHLNIARNITVQGLKTERLVELNLAASQKAKRANAYEVAANYTDIALELLPISTWQDNYALMLAVYQEASQVQYLNGNFIYAEQLSDIVLRQAKTVLDQIQVYKIRIHTQIARNQMQLAVDIGLHVLDLLAIRLSDDVADSAEHGLCFDLDDRQIETLSNLAPMSDRDQLEAIEILTIIIPPVYIVRPQLLLPLISEAISILLKYGNSPCSAYVYAMYGLLLCASGNIKAGYRLGQLALELQTRFRCEKNKPKVHFLFNNMIRHWREPAANTVEHLLTGIAEAAETGDLEYACFNAKYYCTYLLFVGEDLSLAEAKAARQIETIARFQQEFQLNYARIWHQVMLNLQGQAADKLLLVGSSFDESKMLVKWQQANDATSLFGYYLAKLILSYFFQDYQGAINYSHQGRQYLNASVGTMCYGEHYFYSSLAVLATYKTDSLQEPETLPAEIIEERQKIKYWADNSPKNYQHKCELIDAEIARVTGKHEEAAEHYDLAIAQASEAGYQHLSALAKELAGKFYLSKGRTKIASYYLYDAYKSYRHWGAMGKVRDLELKHSRLLNLVGDRQLIGDPHQAKLQSHRDESFTDLANLDLLSVIKASQAISSEIILDNLLSKLIAIVMENAGAQKSVLLLQQDSAWVVAASASMELEQRVDLPSVSISEYYHLPYSMINYVQSTHQTVLLEQASESEMFDDDPYVIKFQPKSILCCPIIYQHELQGIIYLENSLVRGAFTSEKLAVLQALLSQVSISIVNARLYKDLEDHASVQKSLRQKEILLKEIHHRVKNNLFVVSSLLDFQSSYVEDPEVNKLLENCQNRITAMAMVHQYLYGSSELNRINFAQYIESLLDNLAYSQGSKERNINLILDLEPIELNIESANPCGLIVNELISNALEHGFSDRSGGNIWVKLQHGQDSQIVLTIEDDGVGFKTGLNLHNSDSLGLELVCTLVEQLDGEINLDQAKGTKIEIAFKELNYSARISS